MRNITKISEDTYRVQIRRQGQPSLTQTFTGKKAEEEAIKWRDKQEEEIAAGKKVGRQGKTGVTIAEAAKIYLEENPKLNIVAVYSLKRFVKACGKTHLSKVTEDTIYDYIAGLNVAASTGLHAFAVIKAFFKYAKISMKMHVPDVMKHAYERLTFDKAVAPSKERNRRPTQEELEMLYDYDWNSHIPMVDLIKFAILSAMRRAEILRIKFKTTDEAHHTTLIEDRKHPTKKIGNHQVVPVLDEAMEIIKRQPKSDPDGRIFPYNGHTVTNLFSKACRKLGIKDLHFHDLRHEGTSRLFEMGYAIHEVAMFTGHEDWKMLERYTHLKAKDIRRLDRKEESKAKVESKHVLPPMPVPLGLDENLLKEFQKFLKMKEMMEAA